MKIRHLVIIGCCLGAIAKPSHACERDPFLFQLPGETVQKAEARSEQIGADIKVASHFAREKYSFEHAASIFLARVTSEVPFSDSAGKMLLPSTTLQPLASLKGAMPKQRQVLTDEAQTGACTDYGDGHGAWGKIGDLVVVFVGLPKTRQRPNGIDSFDVSEIRTIELLDKLREFGKDLED